MYAMPKEPTRTSRPLNITLRPTDLERLARLRAEIQANSASETIRAALKALERELARKGRAKR